MEQSKQKTLNQRFVSFLNGPNTGAKQYYVIGMYRSGNAHVTGPSKTLLVPTGVTY